MSNLAPKKYRVVKFEKQPSAVIPLLRKCREMYETDEQRLLEEILKIKRNVGTDGFHVKWNIRYEASL